MENLKEETSSNTPIFVVMGEEQSTRPRFSREPTLVALPDTHVIAVVTTANADAMASSTEPISSDATLLNVQIPPARPPICRFRSFRRLISLFRSPNTIDAGTPHMSLSMNVAIHANRSSQSLAKTTSSDREARVLFSTYPIGRRRPTPSPGKFEEPPSLMDRMRRLPSRLWDRIHGRPNFGHSTNASPVAPIIIVNARQTQSTAPAVVNVVVTTPSVELELLFSPEDIIETLAETVEPNSIDAIMNDRSARRGECSGPMRSPSLSSSDSDGYANWAPRPGPVHKASPKRRFHSQQENLSIPPRHNTDSVPRPGLARKSSSINTIHSRQEVPPQVKIFHTIVRSEDNPYFPYQLRERIRLPKGDGDYLKRVGERGPNPGPHDSEPAFVNGLPYWEHKRYPNPGRQSRYGLDIPAPFSITGLDRYPQQLPSMPSRPLPHVGYPQSQPYGRPQRKETDSYNIWPARPSIIIATQGHQERFWIPKSKKQQPIRFILPELDIPLSDISVRSSDTNKTLKFSMRVTEIIKQRISSERFPSGCEKDPQRGIFLGLDDPRDDGRSGKITKIVIKRWHSNGPGNCRRPGVHIRIPSRFDDDGLLDSPDNVRLQIPEAIVSDEDLHWDNDGHLVVEGAAMRTMLTKATLWLPHTHQAVKNFDTLSTLPTSASQMITDEAGNVDLVKTHLIHGRWTWLTAVATREDINGKLVDEGIRIHVDRTAEFDDARMMLLRCPDNTKPLMDFCNGDPVLYKEFPKDPSFKLIADRLRSLIVESHAAGKEEEHRLDSNLEYDQKSLQLWKVDYFVGENSRVAVTIKKAIKERDGVVEIDVGLTFGQRIKSVISDIQSRRNLEPREMFEQEKWSKPKPWWEELQDTSDSNHLTIGYGLGWRGGFLHDAARRDFTDIEQAFRIGREKLKLVSNERHFFFARNEDEEREKQKLPSTDERALIFSALGREFLTKPAAAMNKTLTERDWQHDDHICNLNTDHPCLSDQPWHKTLGVALRAPSSMMKRKKTGKRGGSFDVKTKPQLVRPWCNTCDKELLWNDGHVPACYHPGMSPGMFLSERFEQSSLAARAPAAAAESILLIGKDAAMSRAARRKNFNMPPESIPLPPSPTLSPHHPRPEPLIESHSNCRGSKSARQNDQASLSGLLAHTISQHHPVSFITELERKLTLVSSHSHQERLVQRAPGVADVALVRSESSLSLGIPESNTATKYWPSAPCLHLNLNESECWIDTKYWPSAPNSHLHSPDSINSSNDAESIFDNGNQFGIFDHGPDTGLTPPNPGRSKPDSSLARPINIPFLKLHPPKDHVGLQKKLSELNPSSTILGA